MGSKEAIIKILFFSMSFLPCLSTLCAQPASVYPHEFLPEGQPVQRSAFEVFRYPLIRLSNDSLERAINDKIKYMVFYEEEQDSSIPLDTLLQEAADNAYICSLDFLIGRSDANLLSLHIFGEFYTTDYSRWSRSLTFELQNGNLLRWSDLMSNQGAADAVVSGIQQQKLDCLAAREQELSDLHEIQKQLDIKDLQNISFNISQCRKRLNVTEFFLWPDYLQIVDPCRFSRLMQQHEPDCDLLFRLDDIEGFRW